MSSIDAVHIMVDVIIVDPILIYFNFVSCHLFVEWP